MPGSLNQDNSTKNVLRKIKSKWPSQSLDLNPIAHMWKELGKRVRNRTFSNKNAFFISYKKINFPNIYYDKI